MTAHRRFKRPWQCITRHIDSGNDLAVSISGGVSADGPLWLRCRCIAYASFQHGLCSRPTLSGWQSEAEAASHLP